jgi:hypothetical protein
MTKINMIDGCHISDMDINVVDDMASDIDIDDDVVDDMTADVVGTQ